MSEYIVDHFRNMVLWRVVLPYDKPPLNLNQRLHNRSIGHIRAKLKAHVIAESQDIPKMDTIHVRFYYLPKANLRRDRDNLIPTLKSCIDGLVPHVITDDTPLFMSWQPPIILPAQRFARARLWITVEEGKIDLVEPMRSEWLEYP